LPGRTGSSGCGREYIRAPVGAQLKSTGELPPGPARSRMPVSFGPAIPGVALDCPSMRFAESILRGPRRVNTRVLAPGAVIAPGIAGFGPLSLLLFSGITSRASECRFHPKRSSAVLDGNFLVVSSQKVDDLLDNVAPNGNVFGQEGILIKGIDALSDHEKDGVRGQHLPRQQ